MQTQFKISSDKTSMYLRNALLQMKLITPKHIKRDPLDGSMYLETATTRLRVQVKTMKHPSITIIFYWRKPIKRKGFR